VYRELEATAGVTKILSERFHDAVRMSNALGGQAKALATEYDKLDRSARGFLHHLEAADQFSAKWIERHRKHAQATSELKTQYERLAVASKLLQIAEMSAADKTKAVLNGLEKLSGGTVATIAKLTTLTLTYKHLSDTLLEYRRTVFDGMRIGERYGDSLAKYNAALSQVNKTTAFSKQEFAELNLSIKQMSVGIPMTSQRIAELATALSGRLGWSADKVKKSITDLIPLQNKLPSLFDRIKVAMAGGAKEANALYDKLKAIGASRQEIESAMTMVSMPTADLSKWMDFEKTMAKANRDIKDANLEIADKMRRGLEMVAKVQAAISKGVAALHPAIMLATAAFAMFGAQVAKALNSVIAISNAMSGIKGKTGLAGAAGSSIFGGGFGKSLAWGIGGAAVATGSETLADRWASGMVDERGVANTGGMMVAKGLGGAVSGAASGFTLGMMAGKGKWQAALALGLLGAAGGAWRGYRQGEAINKEGADLGSLGLSRMALAAKTSGIDVDEGASREKILESIRNETNVEKQKLALQTLLANGQIRIEEVEAQLVKSVADEEKRRKAVSKIVIETASGANALFEKTMQISAAVDAQTEELERQVEIYNKMANAGKNAAQQLAEGTLGADAAKMLMGVGLEAQKKQVEALQEQASLAFVRAARGKTSMQDLVFGKGDANRNKALDEAADKHEKIFERMKKAEEVRLKYEADANRLAAKPEERKKVVEKGGAELAIIQEEIANLTRERQELLSGIQLPKLDTKQFVSGYAEINAELEKAKEAIESAKTPEALRQAMKDFDELASRMSPLIDSVQKLADAVSGPFRQALAAATAETQRQVGMNEQLLNLNEARLALAEKMGMPQSYRALKDQVQLTYQQYQAYEKQFETQKGIIAGHEKTLGITIDYQSVLNNTKTTDQVIAEAKAEAAKQGAEAAKQGKDITFYEQDIVTSIKAQVEAATKMVQTEGKLAELTKTWREGWMDAMEETVINAGDFAAVIGLGDKNVPEKIAAGGIDTFRYGGVNRAALDAYTLQQLRGSQAPMFTDQYGMMNGNIQNPSPLMRLSGAGQNVYQNGQGVAAAAAGIVPVLPGQSPLSQAGIDQISQAVASGVRQAIVYTPGATGPMQPGDYAKAGIKWLGVDQPGGSPVPFREPQIVRPFAAAGDKMGAAVDKFDAAVSRMGGMFNVQAGHIQTRAGGGVVHAQWGRSLGQAISRTPSYSLSGMSKALGFQVDDILAIAKAKRIPPTKVIEDLVEGSRNSGPMRKFASYLERIAKSGGPYAESAQRDLLALMKTGRVPRDLSTSFAQFLARQEMEKALASISVKGTQAASASDAARQLMSRGTTTQVASQRAPRFKPFAGLPKGTVRWKGGVAVTAALAGAHYLGRQMEGSRHGLVRGTGNVLAGAGEGGDELSGDILSMLGVQNKGVRTIASGATSLGYLNLYSGVALGSYGAGKRLFHGENAAMGYVGEYWTGAITNLLTRRSNRETRTAEAEALAEINRKRGTNFKSFEEMDRHTSQRIQEKRRQKQEQAKQEAESFAFRKQSAAEYEKLQADLGITKFPPELWDKVVKIEAEMTNALADPKAADVSGFSPAAMEHMKSYQFHRDMAGQSKTIKERDLQTDVMNKAYAMMVAEIARNERAKDAAKQQAEEVASNQRKADERASAEWQFRRDHPNVIGTVETDYGTFHRGYDRKSGEITVTMLPDAQPSASPASGVPQIDPSVAAIKAREDRRVAESIAMWRAIEQGPQRRMNRPIGEPVGSRGIGEPVGSRGRRRNEDGNNFGSRGVTRIGETPRGVTRIGETPRGVRRMADGGMIEPGSYVVKSSAAAANTDALNAMGAGWVTGGIPGKDSVMFGVGMASGGSPGGTAAILMPGEAVVPPEFAAIGEAINKGIARFAGGGALPDEYAMRDIMVASRGAFAGGGGSTAVTTGGGTVTVELGPEASQLLRFQGRGEYSNGSTP
jgi:hypothetical protein